MATVRVPAVQGMGLQNPAVPEAARVDQDPAVPEATQDLVIPAVPDPVATNKMNNCGGIDLLDKLLQHSNFPLLYKTVGLRYI